MRTKDQQESLELPPSDKSSWFDQTMASKTLYDSLTHVKAQPSEFKGASKFCIRSAVNRF